MDNVLIMQRSNSPQRVFKYALRHASWQVRFGHQAEEIICEEFVDVHRPVGYRILRQAKVRTRVDLAVDVMKILKIRNIFQYKLLILIAARKTKVSNVAL